MSNIICPEDSFNTEHKVLIRESWNKPLLKFLSKKIEDRLVYMGLPSPNAEDLNQWIDLIKIVIAFQCRKYNQKSESSQGREDIEKLESLLRTMEREKKIENYVVYDGYLEEVVLKGFDNSPQRINYSNSKFITLYNLDFCNDIASPIEFVDEQGNQKFAYKFDAIKKLLEFQKDISNISSKFIFLLTVHCSYKGNELQNFLNDPPNVYVRDYLSKCYKLKSLEKNSRIVRLFICYLVNQYFPTFDFTPQFLPVIRYNGRNNTPLMHFVIMGIHSQSQAGSIPILQKFEEIIHQRFVEIKSNKFINSDKIFENERIVNEDPMKYFIESRTYQKLWS